MGVGSKLAQKSGMVKRMALPGNVIIPSMEVFFNLQSNIGYATDSTAFKVSLKYIFCVKSELPSN
jgi:hypothetical protein